jgi:hypothetical protein
MGIEREANEAGEAAQEAHAEGDLLQAVDAGRDGERRGAHGRLA